jgi:hypothetical protein
MQKLLLASTSSDWDVQVFIVPHLFGKPNYKLPGFLLWLHRFAANPPCRMWQQHFHFMDFKRYTIRDILKDCFTVPFSLLHYLFTFSLPISYRSTILFSFFPHVIFSFLLSVLTSTLYNIKRPHKNMLKKFRSFLLLFCDTSYIFLISFYFPLFVYIFLDFFL